MGPRLACLALAVMTLFSAALAHADTVGDCHIGAYRLADGGLVDINASDGDALRWRRWDGETGALHPGAGGVWTSTLGWTGRPDGKTVSFSDCASGASTFAGEPGRRIAFDVTETTFQGDGRVNLAGRLVLPRGAGAVPVVILVHGSEHLSARDFYPLQRLLPAEGVGVFVYDKRGTGASGGKYTQDFSVLADDAVAAMREARRLAGARAGRVGYFGTSEGGWVAPIAAARAPVDFVIVGYGLAVSVLEEDRSEVALEMKLKGDSDADIAKALQVADAAEALFASNFTRGFARLDGLREKYRAASWYKDLHGNFTHFILPYTDAQMRAGAKAYDFGTPWRYDPMPTLRQAKTPELWILGADDLEAPSAETGRRIEALGRRGKPFTLAVFPRAEHGIYEFETRPDGGRDDTRNPDGYFAMIADFARFGRLCGAYGDSVLTPPPARALTPPPGSRERP
ncbi:MAG TPA: alpha/beta hydrolase [Caulobacteraceae bacterium]|nr:alpha/beta hydrolase [Caulobacteraceae bacterium]